MASSRVNLILKGKIIGADIEVDCLVSCVEVSLPGTSEKARARYSVHQPSVNLPDGQYEIKVAGEPPFPIRKKGDFWLSI